MRCKFNELMLVIKVLPKYSFHGIIKDNLRQGFHKKEATVTKGECTQSELNTKGTEPNKASDDNSHHQVFFPESFHKPHLY